MQLCSSRKHEKLEEALLLFVSWGPSPYPPPLTLESMNHQSIQTDRDV
uniref:Uncharacterized protein n=1 Tax=Populus trichocarpa TaxID=3694 RepID=A0A3N7G7P4_POPTR